MKTKLFAKFDPKMASSKRVRRAGWEAELLYVRGILFCKDSMTDGVIDESQLEIVGLGIPLDLASLAKRLVDVGLWESTKEGWRIAPDKWAEWQTTNDELESERERKSQAGKKGMQKRWNPDNKSLALVKEEEQQNDNGDNAAVNAVRYQNYNTCYASDMSLPLLEIEVEIEKELNAPAAQAVGQTAAGGCPTSTSPPVVLLTFPVDGRPNEWRFTQSLADELAELFPHVDIAAESRSMLAYVKANPTKRKTASGMRAYITRWLTRSTNNPQIRAHTANGSSAPMASPTAARLAAAMQE